MPKRPLSIAWLLLPILLIVSIGPLGRPAWAVATLDVMVTTMTGQPIPNSTFTLEREEDEKEGQPGQPMVVTTDGSGRAKVENLRPGTYTLKSAASGLRATEAVTVKEGQTVERWITPSNDPENPGPGNFALGVGGYFVSRSLDITRRTTTIDDGSKTTTTSADTNALNRQNRYDLDTHVGFAQLGYGLPRVGFMAMGGYVGLDTTLYGRVGAGTTSVTVKGPDDSFTVDSGAAAFLGGGLNAKLTHSNSPVYAVFGFSWYYMDLGGSSTTRESPAGALEAKLGSQFGWDVSLIAGAKLGRLFPNQLPPQLGKVNLQAGLVGSFLSVDATSKSSQPGSCTTVPGKVLGPFPDSPREPDQVVCTGDSHASAKRTFSEQSAIGGRLAITSPIFGRSSGLLQGDFGGDWWSILAKLSLALDP